MNGLRKTLELLARTRNDAALDVLLPALNSPLSGIRDGALLALLDRNDLHAQREIVRRMPTASADWCRLIENRRDCLSLAIREGVFGADRDQCARVCEAVCLVRNYDAAPVFSSALVDGPCLFPDLVARALLRLAQLLHDEVQAPRDYSRRRDPHKCRRDLLTALERAVRNFDQHGRGEALEAFLLLAPHEQPFLRTLLADRTLPAHAPTIEILRQGVEPSVMRLLADFLCELRPPEAALALIAERADTPFVMTLLRKLGTSPPRMAALNLKQLERLPWCDPTLGVLRELPEDAQSAAVAVLLASGVDREEVFQAVCWLYKFGHPLARRQAAEALAQFPGRAADQLIDEAAFDTDPQVRAAALRQLRPRGLPGALERLIAAVDDAEEVVRAAARAALPEFNARRFFARFDSMEPSVRETTARLVFKIDREACGLLREELAAPVESRRLRAVHVARAAGAAREVLHELLGLLDDADSSVRAAAALVLRDADSPETRAALQNAVADRSRSVQQAALRSLQTLEGLPDLEPPVALAYPHTPVASEAGQ